VYDIYERMVAFSLLDPTPPVAKPAGPAAGTPASPPTAKKP
jgi:hypothetical protein